MKASRRDLLILLTMLGLLASGSLALSSSTNSSGSSGSSSSSSSSSTSSSSKATQARQSPMSAATAIVSAVGSLMPGFISNIAPLVLLVGLGALMMPQLGLSAMGLLRESRRSAQDQHIPLAMPANHFGHLNGQFNLPRPVQTSPQDIYYFTKRSLDTSPTSGASSWMPSSEQVVHGLRETLERVSRALENADRRYS